MRRPRPFNHVVQALVDRYGARLSIRTLKRASDLDFREQYCVPFTHDWDVRHVLTAPDISSRGDLWRCRKCPMVKAK